MWKSHSLFSSSIKVQVDCSNRRIIMLVVRLMAILAESQDSLSRKAGLVMASSNLTVRTRVSGSKELRDMSSQVLNISKVLQNILETPCTFIPVLSTTHSKKVFYVYVLMELLLFPFLPPDSIWSVSTTENSLLPSSLISSSGTSIHWWDSYHTYEKRDHFIILKTHRISADSW